MFCKNCGGYVDEGMAHCPQCGSALAVSQEKKQGDSGSVFFTGLWALILCELPVVGIVLGAKTKAKALRYQQITGELTGRAKAGSILGKLGFIFGIIMTALYLIIIIAALA